jgi:hypothetical protein
MKGEFYDCSDSYNKNDSKQFVVPNETVIPRFVGKISHTSHARPFLLCWWKFGTVHASEGKDTPVFN